MPAADDRAVFNDLLGGIDPCRVECSGFALLVERLLSLPAEGAAPKRVLGPVVLTRWLILSTRQSCQKKRRQLVLLALTEDPSYFWTLEFAETGGVFSCRSTSA